jgi:alpha-1,2-mannosyltransferase
MRTHHFLFSNQLMEKASFITACLFFIAVIMINFLPFLDGKNDLMDFGSFYASGIKSKNGENPYDPNSEYIFEINFSRVGAGGKMMNLNPPISIVIFEYLSQVDPQRALIIWQITSAVLYTGSVFLLASSYRQNMTPTKFIWAFTLAGFWHTLVLGQIYVLLLLFTVLGWIFLQRGKYTLAGIAIGLVIAIKPNFVLWPIFLLVSGYFVTALISLISSLVVSLIPILIYGTRIYAQWLEASSLRFETLIMPGNNSILGLTGRFHSITLGVILSIIIVIALLVMSKLRLSENLDHPDYVSALGIIASLLASPISWTGYTILLLPSFLSLKKWTIPVIISAAILMIPFQIVLQFFQISFVNFVIFGWLYGWGILLLLGQVIKNTVIANKIQATQSTLTGKIS